MIPAIHLFNPGHETAVLSGKESYTSPANVRKMQEDLELLPLWYANAGDYVWTGNDTNRRFTSLLPKDIQLPGTLLSPKNIHNYIPQEMKAAPWGWSPQIIRKFNDLNKKYGTSIQTPKWNEAYTELTSRQTAAECIKRLQLLLPGLNIPAPRFCSTIEEIEDYLRINSSPCVIKTPYSSSGRGLLWIKANILSDKDKAWINGAIQKQGCVSIETGLERINDFALEFYINQEGNISFEGLSLFGTKTNGSYSGSGVMSQENMEEAIARFVDFGMYVKVKEAITQVVQSVYGPIYRGYLGVDMMAYKNKEGQSVIHPCIEINMRYTMGLVALRLFEQFISGNGCFSFIVSYDSNAYEKHLWMRKAYPLILKNGKIQEGYLSLCPVRADTHYRAYIIGA